MRSCTFRRPCVPPRLRRRAVALAWAWLFCCTAKVAAAQSGTAGTGGVHGTARDSITNTLLVGASIAVTGLEGDRVREVVTDANGRYAADSLTPGRYVIHVQQTWLDSIGLTVPAETVFVAAGETVRLDLGVPSAATIYEQSCHTPLDSLHGVLVGYVRGAEDGDPIPNAMVTVRWGDFARDMTTMRLRTFQRGGFVRSDSAGRFRACGVPQGRHIIVQAALDSVRTTGFLDAMVDSTGLRIERLRIGTSPHVASVGPYTLVGTVHALSGKPVQEPRVSLVGGAASTTGTSDGSFSLPGLFAGTMGLQIQAVGYSPLRVAVDVGPGMTPDSFTLTPAAVLLKSVRSYARSMAFPLRLRDFEDRLHHYTSGKFLTAEQIKHYGAWEVSDLLRVTPQFKVVHDRFKSTIELRHPLIGGSRIGVSCPQVFVDGFELHSQDELSFIYPDDLYGAEIYPPHEAGPPGYPNLCGLIFFWRN